MHRRFQILSLFSLPFLLSGILFFVHRQERTARESFAQEEVRERWTRSAREALSHMQAGHSFEDQINLMGIRLNGFLMDSWGRSAGSYNLRVGKLLVSSFVRAFPRRHRPNGIVLYGFRIDNFGKIALVPGNKPGKGLSHGQERMLPELLEGFIALSRNQAPTGLSPAALTA